ncbi:MAG: DeoR family transcriptional regulator [Oscillospiraceae bacterium]|jgi:central glycolytic genes regulator|nr:DeoR family transcriptional regulator [Oscillospiraceae bacterium]
MDQESLTALWGLAPDLMEALSRRAWILERIAVLQPIGRRALAARLRLPEREVRAVAQALRDGGYIALDGAGMCVTPQARAVLDTARALSHGLRGLATLEAALSRLLGGRVAVVPGDADADAQVLPEVGRVAAAKLRALLSAGDVLAVTGGGTMAQVARQLPAGAPLDVLVLPARGGMGRAVETQADTLAAEFARRLGGRYRLLQLPDQLGPGAWQEMLKLPAVRETVDLLRSSDVLLHGIGRADAMLVHRAMPVSAAQRILAQGAVAEAFGYYFDAQGQAVYTATSVGMDLPAVARVRSVAAVAAGASKAEAILAVMRHRAHALLVTDEGAALRMLELCR